MVVLNSFCIKTYFIGLFLILLTGSVNAQNLVPNSDFESYTSCPTNISQNNLIPPWSNVTGTPGTVDYLNACYTSGVAGQPPSVPISGFGKQTAHSGVGYIGLYSYQASPIPGTSINYREYLTVQLIAPLSAGTTYSIGYYASRADTSVYSSDGLGAYLSMNALSGSMAFQPLPFAAQVNNPAGNMMTDTVNWFLVSGLYTAFGGESYLTIGNFKNNLNTAVQVENASGSIDGAYYFIDDVFVIPSNIQISGNDICMGESVTLQASGDTQYQWAESTHPTTIIGTNSSLSVTPSVTTTYIVTGLTGTASFTVNVTNLPAINLGSDTLLCTGQSLLLDATAPNASYSWQDNSINSSFNVTTAGKYWVSLQIGVCETSDTILVSYTFPPIVDLGPDLIVCSGETIQLNATFPSSTYLWNTGSSANQISVIEAGIYSVQLTNSCGTSSDDIEISNKTCACLVYIPNTFTPGSDEFNSLFGAKYDCDFIDFNLTIFNRWGNVIWESKDPEIHWDGTFENKIAQDGLYFYSLKYSSEFVLNESITGHLILLR